MDYSTLFFFVFKDNLMKEEASFSKLEKLFLFSFKHVKAISKKIDVYQSFRHERLAARGHKKSINI